MQWRSVFLPDDEGLRYWFVAVLLVGIGLRVAGVGDSLWLDESISLLQAQPGLAESVDLVQDDVHVPLYTLVLNVWLSVFGESVVAARLLSVLFAVASLLGLFAYAKRFVDELVGVYASALFAVSDIVVYYGQEIRPYSLFVFLAVVSFYAYSVYRETGGGLGWYTVVNAALCYTHPFAAFVLAAQALHHVYEVVVGSASWRSAWWLAGSYVATGLAFVPWLPTLFDQVQRSTLAWIPETTASVVVSSYTVYFTPIGSAVVAGLAGYAFFSGDEPRGEGSWLSVVAAWAVVPGVFLLVASLAIRPFFHSRYLLFTAPALYILVAAVIRGVPRRAARVGVASVLVVSMLVTPVVEGGERRDDWEGVSAYLEEHRDGEPVFVQPYYHQQALVYYYVPECFAPGEVFSCSERRASMQSITRHNCCTAGELHDGLIEDRVPDGEWWLIVVRDAEKGEVIRDWAERRRSIAWEASFPRGIDVYRVTS